MQFYTTLNKFKKVRNIFYFKELSVKHYAFIFFIISSHINFGSETDMNVILQEQQYRVSEALQVFRKRLPFVITKLEKQMAEFNGKQKSVPTTKVIALIAKAKKIQAEHQFQASDNPTFQSNEAMVVQKNKFEEILFEVADYRKELRIEKELKEMIAARQIK